MTGYGASRPGPNWPIDERVQFYSGANERASRRSANSRHREILAQLLDLTADALDHRGIVRCAKHLEDPAADLLHFAFFHTARREGRSADADAARVHRLP